MARRVIAVLAVAMTVGALGTTGFANASSTNETVCEAKGGALKVTSKCAKGSHRVTLAATGVRGTTGATGATGAKGATGLQGLPGLGAGAQVYDVTGKQVGKLVDSDEDVLVNGTVWNVNDGDGSFSPDYANRDYTTNDCTGTAYYAYVPGDSVGHTTYRAPGGGAVVTTGTVASITPGSFTTFDGATETCSKSTGGVAVRAFSTSVPITVPASVPGPLAVRS